jgi:lipid II:glycine glycyltransferase (peptidoglycan interpeptide bridge formation enzyme)
LRELVITPPEWRYDEVSTSVALAGRTLGNQQHSVRYVASEDVGQNVDFLLPFALLPAMVTESRLKLPGAVSPRLYSAAPKVQDIFYQWEEEFEIFPPRRVTVDAEVESRNDKRASGVACFFSGGVDSFYTLLKNLDEVTHLIFVHGVDIPLSNFPLREQAGPAVREVARELGKSLIEVATDLRSFSDPLVHWGQYQGAALASVGLLFQHLFRKILIPATFSYADLLPWGAHPLLDPLWSTELTDFEHDGCEATRVEKAAYISSNEVAMKWLRVCWLTPASYDYNCGRCGKCLTTMINLRVAGALERCETLPHTIDPKDISEIDATDRDGLVFTRQNISALERSEGDPELIRALQRAIQPPPLYPRRRYEMANVLTGEAPLRVSGIRKLVRRHHGVRLREISDPAEWNAAVQALGGSIAQSWEWGVFHRIGGWKPLRLLDEEGRGAVQLLIYEQPGGFSVAYAPYGPLVKDASDLTQVVEAATRRARECRAYLVRFEPRQSVDADRGILGGDRYTVARRDLPGSTLIVDIPVDPEEHFRALPQDTRSGILKAHSQGVEVETLSRNSIERGGIQEFLNLLWDASRRQGFSLAPAGYYWNLTMVLPACLLVARHQGRPVAGALIATFGEEAYYFYGALSADEKNLCALDLVQWEAMEIARKKGCTRYDMWGLPYRPHPGYWAWGYDPSKNRFGGTPIEYVEPSMRVLNKVQLWEQSAINFAVEGHGALGSLYDKVLGR